MKTRPKAFTLIELLVVLAIIALLAGLIFPVYARSRQRAARTQCISQMHQIGQLLRVYQQDNDGKFPVFSVVGPLTLETSKDLFWCPNQRVREKKPYVPNVINDDTGRAFDKVTSYYDPGLNIAGACHADPDCIQSVWRRLASEYPETAIFACGKHGSPSPDPPAYEPTYRGLTLRYTHLDSVKAVFIPPPSGKYSKIFIQSGPNVVWTLPDRGLSGDDLFDNVIWKWARN